MLHGTPTAIVSASSSREGVDECGRWQNAVLRYHPAAVQTSSSMVITIRRPGAAYPRIREPARSEWAPKSEAFAAHSALAVFAT